jgi:beta-1,4-N-acetylglucosaminyltransferase
MELKGTGIKSTRRECLITTGATAPFPDLIKAALDCLDTFSELGFTHITFQVGDGIQYFNEIKPIDLQGLSVDAFALSDGLYSQMRRLKPKINHDGQLEQEEGLLITHAGKSLYFEEGGA